MEYGESSSIGGKNEIMEFPLGFRFYPHPQELVFYVKLKNFDLPLSIEIPEVDLNECHPKRLTTEKDSSFGIYGTGRYYYFTKRKRRNQSGSRIKRSMNEGYWKGTSGGKVITYEENKEIGYEKTFTFFEGKGKNKKPTKWIMHEYRDLNMDESTSNIEKYVLCMIYENGKKCPTNYPPSIQAIMNTGADAIEEARESSIPQNQSMVRESSIPQNQSMVYVSQPHEANMDQFQLPPYLGNYNEFPSSQEYPDDARESFIPQTQSMVRESSIPQNQSMVYVSQLHEANMDQFQLPPYVGNYNEFPETSQPHEANMDQFQLPPYLGNYNEFPSSQEFLDDARESSIPQNQSMVGEGSIPQNQSMVYVSQPHEANMDQFQLPPYVGNYNEFPETSQLHEANMDQFQLPPYLENYNEFLSSQEFLDDVMRIVTPADLENMQLDFLNSNPNTMC